MPFPRLTTLTLLSGLVYAFTPHSSHYEQRLKLSENPGDDSRQTPLFDIARPGQHRGVPIRNSRNLQYSVDIYIGDTAKPYRVIIDTSGSNLLIPRNDEDKGEGTFSSADVTIGDIKVENQEYSSIPIPGLSPYLDGILGLGYDTHDDDHHKPLLNNMFEQNLIDEPKFAVYLGDIERNQSSEIIFGGSDPSRFEGGIVHLPVSRKGHWEVPLDSIAFGDQEVQLEETTALFDTGTAIFVLPYSLAGIINHEIGAVMDSYGNSKVDCEKRQTEPDVTFTFRGKSFAVSAEDYILNSSGTGKACSSGFVGWDLPSPGPTVILGGAFLRRWYSVYDAGNHTIGLAKAV